MAWNPAILVFTQDGKRTHGSRSTDGSYSAKKKKKNISVTELGNPYTLLKRYESRETYKWCKTGEDVSKSECLPVMGKIEVYASARKGAELKQVFHGNDRR